MKSIKSLHLTWIRVPSDINPLLFWFPRIMCSDYTPVPFFKLFQIFQMGLNSKAWIVMIIIDCFDKCNSAKECLFPTFWCQYLKLHFCPLFEQFCPQSRRKSHFLRIFLKGFIKAIRFNNFKSNSKPSKLRIYFLKH